MRTEPLARWMSGLAMALLLSGCASTSTARDLGRVRDLTNVERIASVSEPEVESGLARDVQKLMAQPLTPDAAIRVALLNNRELRATLRELGVTRGRFVQAGLLPNPVVEAELLPEQDSDLELRVEYEITEAVLAPLRRRALEPELEAARYRASAAVVELGYRVRTAVIALQAAEQRLALAQRNLDALAAGRDAVTALLEAGNLPMLDAASQVAEYERARVRVAEVELELAAEREQLQRLLGLSGEATQWTLAAPLSPAPDAPPAPTRLETRALRASFDLAEVRFRLESLARRAGLARTEGWLPDVVIDVHALHRTADEPAAAGDASAWRYGAGVSVTVPLFDRRQGDVLARTSEFDALMERYIGAAIDLRSRMRESSARLRSAHARAKQYQDVILPAQRRVTEQTLLQYNAMQIGVFQLLEARRAELDIELAYIETLREYWSASAVLDAGLAGRLVMAPEIQRTNPRSEKDSGRGAH